MSEPHICFNCGHSVTKTNRDWVPTRSEDSPGRLLCRQEALAGLIRPHPAKPIIPQMGVA